MRKAMNSDPRIPEVPPTPERPDGPRMPEVPAQPEIPMIPREPGPAEVPASPELLDNSPQPKNLGLKLVVGHRKHVHGDCGTIRRIEPPGSSGSGNADASSE